MDHALGVGVLKSVRHVGEGGGGVAGGRQFKAVQIGGPSGGCVPAELADTPADLAIRGDAAAVLSALAATLPEGNSDWTAAEVAQARARWRAEADAERPGIVPVCDALRAVLPPLVADHEIHLMQAAW